MSSYVPLKVGRKRPAEDVESPTSRKVARSGGFDKQYWMVQWRAPQARKHKTWDGDGVLVVDGHRFILYDMEGRLMTGGKATTTLEVDQELFFGSREILIDRSIPPEEYLSGACFGKLGITYQESQPSVVKGPLTKKFVPLRPSISSATARRNTVELEPVCLLSSDRPSSGGQKSLCTSQGQDGPSLAPELLSKREEEHASPVPPSSFYKTSQRTKLNKSLHDPNADGAIILSSPSQHTDDKENLQMVPVVVDPILSRHLRPHQIEGVKFLYERVLGMQKCGGQGAILADDMGLGKTLQTITLIWTLLTCKEQTPYPKGGSVVGKVLVVCPVSLINNWKAEFHKWLGRDRLGIFVGDKDKTVIKRFVNSKIHQVLIIGYERLRTMIEELAYCMPPIGLIICDEGHRLKSANAKSNKMFEVLKTRRRIILSGTPIQNDLGEFHAMAEFCNPGLLGEYPTFRRMYEQPILKSRAPDSTLKETQLGQARYEQLLSISRSFVLRREASILSNYLPPKFEHVVFVKPTAAQISIFNEILRPERVHSIIQGPTAHSLALINRLTKISTSPDLIRDFTDIDSPVDGPDSDCEIAADKPLSPSSIQSNNITSSGKLLFLFNILRQFRLKTDEKCVVVSHFTSTLDLIEKILKEKKYSYCRLDGQTPMAKRQDTVHKFNKTSQDERFVFLLSAKAGGVGLNLIGGSRLILVDSDWNPSHDLQAMARIHRDGQKRPVYIYRLLTAGTIDEKIFQRQVTKMGLSESFMNQKTNEKHKSQSDSFSTKELRDIFTIRYDVECHTHDLLGCRCSIGNGADVDGFTSESECDIAMTDQEDDTEDELDRDDFKKDPGFVIATQVDQAYQERVEKRYKKVAALKSLTEWTHINCLRSTAITALHDEVLSQMVCRSFNRVERNDENSETQKLDMSDLSGGAITFVFERCLKTAVDSQDYIE